MSLNHVHLWNMQLIVRILKFAQPDNVSTWASLRGQPSFPWWTSRPTVGIVSLVTIALPPSFSSSHSDQLARSLSQTRQLRLLAHSTSFICVFLPLLLVVLPWSQSQPAPPSGPFPEHFTWISRPRFFSFSLTASAPSHSRASSPFVHTLVSSHSTHTHKQTNDSLVGTVHT